MEYISDEDELEESFNEYFYSSMADSEYEEYLAEDSYSSDDGLD